MRSTRSLLAWMRTDLSKHIQTVNLISIGQNMKYNIMVMEFMDRNNHLCYFFVQPSIIKLILNSVEFVSRLYLSHLCIHIVNVVGIILYNEHERHTKV